MDGQLASADRFWDLRLQLVVRDTNPAVPALVIGVRRKHVACCGGLLCQLFRVSSFVLLLFLALSAIGPLFFFTRLVSSRSFSSRAMRSSALFFHALGVGAFARSLVREVVRDLCESLARPRVEARAVKEFERAILPWSVPNIRSSRLWVEKRMCVGVHAGGWLRLLRLPTVDDFGSNGQELLAGLRVIAEQVEDLDRASVINVPDNWLTGARVEEFRRTVP